MEEVNALKTLKDPAHGWAVGWLVHLIGNGLRRLSELAAQHVFCQAIHQQAENHDEAQSNHAFRLLDEHR